MGDRLDLLVGADVDGLELDRRLAVRVGPGEPRQGVDLVCPALHFVEEGHGGDVSVHDVPDEVVGHEARGIRPGVVRPGSLVEGVVLELGGSAPRLEELNEADVDVRAPFRQAVLEHLADVLGEAVVLDDLEEPQHFLGAVAVLADVRGVAQGDDGASLRGDLPGVQDVVHVTGERRVHADQVHVRDVLRPEGEEVFGAHVRVVLAGEDLLGAEFGEAAHDVAGTGGRLEDDTS